MARGHRVVSCDSDCWSCLVCGAHFADSDDDVSACTGRTDLVHGSTRESGHDLECETAAAGKLCEHVDPDCRCDFC